MLAGLLAFAMGSTVAAILGALVFLCVPEFQLTIENLVIFALAGSAGGLSACNTYNRVLADFFDEMPNGFLAVAGSMIALVAGGAVCGSALVWLNGRFFGSGGSRRWTLPAAQLIIALAMLQQVLAFGLLGTLGSLGMSTTGHFDVEFPGYLRFYRWGLLTASIGLDIAALLSLIGAVASLIKPSVWTVRLSATGAMFYWTFVVAALFTQQASVGIAGWSLNLTLAFKLMVSGLHYVKLNDVMPYCIGALSVMLAYALHRLVQARQSRRT